MLNFLGYPGIWGPLLILHLIIFWWQFRDFGAPLLFWHDEPMVSLAAGLFSALCVGWGVFLFFFLDYSAWLKNHQRDRSHWTSRFAKGGDAEIRELRSQASLLFRLSFGSIAIYSIFAFVLKLICVGFFILLGDPISFDRDPHPRAQEILQRIEILRSEKEYMRFFRRTTEGWAMNWGMWTFPAGFIIGCFLVLLFDEMNKRLVPESLIKFIIARPSLKSLQSNESVIVLIASALGAVVVAFVFFLLFILSTVFDIHLAAAAICLFLGVAMTAYGFFLFFFRLFPKMTLTILTGVILGFVLLLQAFDGPRYRVRGLEVPGENFIPIRPSSPPPFEPSPTPPRWDSDRPLVLICASGGGITAEVWTINMLTELSKRLDGFADSVMIVTGSSGGMVGAASWAAMQQRDAPNAESGLFSDAFRESLLRVEKGNPGILEEALGISGKHPSQSQLKSSLLRLLHLKLGSNLTSYQYNRAELFLWENLLKHQCRKDQLSAVVTQGVLWDITPWGVLGHRSNSDWWKFRNRGMALERVWTGEAAEVSSGLLPDLGATLADVEYPALIFAPTIAEDGRQLLVSNLNLSLLNQGFDRFPIVKYLEARSVFPSYSSIPLSSWARMNATFPIVSPPSAVRVRPTQERFNIKSRQEHAVLERTIHLVDAGYSDNYNSKIAIDWLWKYWVPWTEARLLEFELRSVDTLSDLPNTGPSRVILAMVAKKLHVRIVDGFDEDLDIDFDEPELRRWLQPDSVAKLKRLISGRIDVGSATLTHLEADVASGLLSRLPLGPFGSSGRAPKQVILIELDAYPRYGPEAWGYFPVSEPGPVDDLVGIFTEDMSAPLSGALSRGVGIPFRNDQAIEEFARFAKKLGESSTHLEGVDFKAFRLVNAVPASLSWTLSSLEKELLEVYSDGIFSLSSEDVSFLSKSVPRSPIAAALLESSQQTNSLRAHWEDVWTDYRRKKILKGKNWSNLWSFSQGEASRRATIPQPSNPGDFLNGTNIEMAWLRPGTVNSKKIVGSGHALREEEKLSILSGFWISRSLITQGQWFEVTAFAQGFTEKHATDKPFEYDWAKGSALLRSLPGLAKSSDPYEAVQNVSWVEAMDFCMLLTDMEREKGFLPDGWRYSLPSWGERESAALLLADWFAPRKQDPRLEWCYLNENEFNVDTIAYEQNIRPPGLESMLPIAVEGGLGTLGSFREPRGFGGWRGYHYGDSDVGFRIVLVKVKGKVDP